MNEQGPVSLQAHPGVPLGLAKLSFLGWRIGKPPTLLRVHGCVSAHAHRHTHTHTKVEKKNWRHPSVPYLQTALVPSGLYLILSFTEMGRH